MSSTTLSSSSASRFQFILDSALQDYTKQTGVDLAKCDFFNQLDICDSPDEVLRLLRVQAKKFQEYRDGNRKLINFVTPIVQVVHVFAAFLGEATSIVSRIEFSPRTTVLMFNPPAPSLEPGKSYFCWCRCSPQCMYHSFSFLPDPCDVYIRRPLGLVPAMMLLSTFSIVSEISSDVSVFIRTCRSLMG